MKPNLSSFIRTLQKHMPAPTQTATTYTAKPLGSIFLTLKIMKYISLVLLVVCSIACNSSKSGFKITGLSTSLPDGTVLYLTDSQTSKTYDSTTVINNKFIFNGKIDSIKFSVIHTKNYGEYLIFCFDNSNILIDARNSNLRNAKISGSEFQNVTSHYISLENSWRMMTDSINRVIRLSDKNDSLIMKRLNIVKDSITTKHEDAILEFIKIYPDYKLNTYYLTFSMLYQSTLTTKKMYYAIPDKFKNDKWGLAVKTFIDKSKDFKIGDMASDFTLPDIYGNQISLSSFKNKYVLLEFWASWCGPCRAENPNLLKLYRKYQKDGFEILGVSLDEQMKVWRNTINSDALIWKNVSDLKGNLGEVPLTYKIVGIPMNFLIDPSGTIIGIDLRDISLENKLKSIFKY
jgi:peroxiredoxin